jgi:catechol 2,3-dioxygenase-like lactoylglutathione lyase family enzyme
LTSTSSEETVQTIGCVSLVVREYDEAITFFTKILSFTLVEDSAAIDREGNRKRWVLVRPSGSRGPDLLLARASTPEEKNRVGDQTGGRVFLFLHTDDFWRDYREMTSRGLKFVRPPREEPYGTVAVFEDLYGNQWDLLQRASSKSAG